MPLVKYLFGRRIRDTKRHGDKILVQLFAETPGQHRQWISLSPEDYRAAMTCVYVSPDAIRDSGA